MKCRRRKKKKVTEEGKRKLLVGLKTTISMMTIIMKERLNMNPVRKRLKMMSQSK